MLTGKQKRFLRSMMETEPAILQIGKDALSDNLIDTVDKALAAREVIKIRILRTAPEDTKELAFDLAMRTRSEIVQIIGRTLILYRRKRDSGIVLP